ncbi:divalent-cation tolerance protein CutA [Candidatus Woesebacteria bacterium]|nr:divalent-cation tolerance protein CutA [Candidatus Woesebacteria bacterium]
MSELILIYSTWESAKQAKKAGKHLLEKRLCACVNILPEVTPLFWWPPKENKLTEGKETVMIIKTLENKYDEIEKEIYKIHTYKTPCIIAIPIQKVNKDYISWIRGEVKE